jgi:hypothetical protein
MWPQFIGLKTGTVGRPLWISGFQKRRKISSPVEPKLALQDEFCSMELATPTYLHLYSLKYGKTVL